MITIIPILIGLIAACLSIDVSSDLGNQIFLTLIYEITLVFAATFILKKMNDLKINCFYPIIIAGAIHLGIMFGYWLGDGGLDMLWPYDTIDHHLPNALKLVSAINGDVSEFNIFSSNPFETIYLSNIWVGLFFTLFGVDPIVSLFAMMLVKFITIYFICQAGRIISGDSRVGYFAGIIYAMQPNITFYTIQFYKEFAIHFLSIVCIYTIAKSSEHKKYYFISMIPLLALIVERFYIAIFLFISILGLIVYKEKNHLFKLFIGLLATISPIMILRYYFPDQNITDLIASLKSLQETHNASPDVSNPASNMFIDFPRIVLTPFITQEKIDNYIKYDSLLIFGGLIHQFIIIFYVIGIWKSRKNTMTLMNASFLFLCLLLAYIQPYNGRARDSLYPMIAIYASIGLIKKNIIKKS